MIWPSPVIPPCNQTSCDCVISVIYNVIHFETCSCFVQSNIPIFRPNYYQQYYENAIMICCYDNVHYCACHVSNSILTRGYLWLSYHLYYLYQNIARSLE